MGRSVSTPPNTIDVAFWHFSLEADEDGFEPDLGFEIECLADYIQSHGQHVCPSFHEVHKFLGREDCALLENRHAYLGFSEYCGLVAVWLAVKDDSNPLALHWCGSVSGKLLAPFQKLRKVASLSNGEAVFERW